MFSFQQCLQKDTQNTSSTFLTSAPAHRPAFSTEASQSSSTRPKDQLRSGKSNDWKPRIVGWSINFLFLSSYQIHIFRNQNLALLPNFTPILDQEKKQTHQVAYPTALGRPWCCTCGRDQLSIQQVVPRSPDRHGGKKCSSAALGVSITCALMAICNKPMGNLSVISPKQADVV